MNKHINIAGQTIPLCKRPAKSLKGINIGEKLALNFFDGNYRGVNMLFVEPKTKNPTPRNCKIYANRLAELFKLPIVFLLNPAPAYERERLMQKDIFFVMSDKYANLPMLVAMERISQRAKTEALSPVAQYILLYHLQVENLEGLSAKEIAQLVPYSYASVAFGLSRLDELSLAEKASVNSKSKAMHFKLSGRDLWDNAKPFLLNPVAKTIFCDGMNTDKELPVSGINALSHYSSLNPDREKWLMTTMQDYREMSKNGTLIHPNEFDGNIILEIWKYPPVARLADSPRVVDRLSLALSLQTDRDPRVENELEHMINDIQW